jgi:hypothetical protein
MSRARLTGIALFAFIPLVLVLYLRRPLGLGPSIGLGVAIMVAHRFVARPFMDRGIDRRCFWCGRDLDGAGVDAPFRSKNAIVPARACSEGHATDLTAFARTVARGRNVLRVMIVLPVLIYLVNAALTLAKLPAIAVDDAVWLFKLPIAAAVVALSFAWRLGRTMTIEPAVDFPPHNLFLLGVVNTLWIFRIVGLIWLAQALWLILPR